MNKENTSNKNITNESIEEKVSKINQYFERHNDNTLLKCIEELGYTKGQLKAIRSKYNFDKITKKYTLKDDKMISNNNNISINFLVEEIKNLTERINNLEEQNDSNEDLRANIMGAMGKYEDKLKGNPTSRQTKVYSNVNKEWTKFCKSKVYSIIDLHSLALVEFMEKYK